jgi:CO dehydrogenase maturation factor
MQKRKIIAVSGKGGAGKTSVSALIIKNLMAADSGKILAIDADPATGLATALGMEPGKTVNDIRKDVVKAVKRGKMQASDDTASLLDYELFGALVQNKNLALLAIGRPEEEGCFCKVNSLLKDIIQDLAARFDMVVIDGEAGVEQINRRVMSNVDSLILVSDTSAKAVNVIKTIAHLVKDQNACRCKDIGLVLNKVRSEAEVENIRNGLPVPIYGYLPEDDNIRAYDFAGRSFLEMPDDDPANRAVQGILKTANIL